MTTMVSAFIALLALSMIVVVIASWQRQREQRESRTLDAMLFRKEEEE